MGDGDRRIGGKRVGCGRRVVARLCLFASFFASLVAGGCASAPGPVFEPLPSAPVWPAPPEDACIRYVGAIATSADLKAPRGFFSSLGGLLGGEEPPQRMQGPRSAVVTPDGQRLWVADPGAQCVHGFDLQHRVYRRVDRVGDAKLLSPVHLSLGPDASLFVCDSQDPAIHRLADRDGELVESLRLPAVLLRPVATAWDQQRGELHVVDVLGHGIKVLDRHGGLLREIGRRGAGPGEFNFPTDVRFDGELFWVVDTGNHRVQALTRGGSPAAEFGREGDAPGDLSLPKGVALDRDGHVYVVDARFENVQIFDRRGRLLLFFGEEGSGPGQFSLPAGIFIDHDDRLWVCDTFNGRVQVFRYVRKEQP